MGNTGSIKSKPYVVQTNAYVKHPVLVQVSVPDIDYKSSSKLLEAFSVNDLSESMNNEANELRFETIHIKCRITIKKKFVDIFVKYFEKKLSLNNKESLLFFNYFLKKNVSNFYIEKKNSIYTLKYNDIDLIEYTYINNVIENNNFLYLFINHLKNTEPYMHLIFVKNINDEKKTYTNYFYIKKGFLRIKELSSEYKSKIKNFFDHIDNYTNLNDIYFENFKKFNKKFKSFNKLSNDEISEIITYGIKEGVKFDENDNISEENIEEFMYRFFNYYIIPKSKCIEKFKKKNNLCYGFLIYDKQFQSFEYDNHTTTTELLNPTKLNTIITKIKSNIFDNVDDDGDDCDGINGGYYDETEILYKKYGGKSKKSKKTHKKKTHKKKTQKRKPKKENPQKKTQKRKR
jgi:hypothetical protein